VYEGECETLNAVSVETQYMRTQEDDLRVLIVGAGIAGVTAAQMLRRDGRHPTLIERNKDQGHPGYMLALLPMVDQALDDLDVHDQYRRSSTLLARYGLHTHTGRLLREDSMASLFAQYGDYRGIGRGELIETLSAHGCDVAFATTVTALTEETSDVSVTLTTGDVSRQFAFDLVIVADGMHSATRKLALGGQPINVVDTRWGGWVVWAPNDEDTDLVDEFWGAGYFLGVYPVKGQLGVFLGGSNEDTKAGASAFVADVRRRLNITTPRADHALTAVANDPDPYYWPMTDCRAPTWTSGHTVLLGDAAAGFLPTAGVGAGMAIESAWVLTRMLRHANSSNIAALLKAYEDSQRPRVESAQDNSRSLARLMFQQSAARAVVRELAARLISLQAALKPIQRLVASQPNPDALAAAVVAERARR
jgi:2-polyprenyl-6-methoxyphenol hydroxylase-like FAD-dependent oxidoreductase